ncbi:hypothetical protein ACOMHN_049204 [Nucella lapillus]
MKTLSPWTLPPDLIPQQIISLGHHMAHNPGMDQQHMGDLAHPLDVMLVALEEGISHPASHSHHSLTALPRSTVFPHSRRLSSEKGPTYHLEFDSFRTGGTYMVKNPQVFLLPSFQDHCPTLSKASGTLQPRFPTPSFLFPPSQAFPDSSSTSPPPFPPAASVLTHVLCPSQVNMPVSF